MHAMPNLLCAPLEQILISGGDTRSVLNAQTGLNSFGCAPHPRPEAFSFGSSTASSISQRAFCHAENQRGALIRLFSQSALAPCDILDVQTEKLRHELTSLLGICANEAEIVFSPSGTDSMLHALFLVRALYGRGRLDCIVPASDATGSGAPNALTGRHFSTMTAEGIGGVKGEPIAGLSENVTLISLPLRNRHGAVRSAVRMDQEVFAAVSRSVLAGHQALLQVMDSSKLGVRCPSSDCLRRLKSRFGDAVAIVVDACQMRLSLVRLQWHLAQGHLVLISGSKFFTGPPFSGALLVPASLSASLETIQDVPTGLTAYTNRSAWPQSWRTLRAALPQRANWGQYFRWTAALEEMRAYFAVPMEFRRAVLQEFAAMTTALLTNRHSDLLLLEDSPSAADEIEDGEMGVRTIFPFLLRQGGEWMSFEDATKLYAALNRNLAPGLPAACSPKEHVLASQLCHIGQPVSVVREEGKSCGALRVCASSRLVADIWARHRGRLAAENVRAAHLNRERLEIEAILDKAALVCRDFDLLTGNGL